MLKMLVLRSRLDKLKIELENLRKKDDEFQTREAELEAAVAEMTEETTEEERKVVEEQVDALDADKTAHEDAKADLEKQIEDIEAEMNDLDERSKKAVPQKRDDKKEETMITRKFFNMGAQERDAFFAREDVKTFLKRAREIAMEKRAVTGAELTIPEVVLSLIRENVQEWSKLYKHVNVQNVPGTARQTIMGTIPEAVWTEMCGKLNELDLAFNDVEVDGYKVGGYFAVCNSVLEDSDIALASELIAALGKSIGLALDKAILYGTGTKMPLGIVTRLVQTGAPEDYPATARAWEDLHVKNVPTGVQGKTGAAFFQAFVLAAAAAKGKYSAGRKFWAMNETTKAKIVSYALSINAAGAIVAGVNSEMPVIGGAIETLEFIPDNVVIGGYGDCYLLAERAGVKVSQSEHVRFIEDQTVFKGTARYDGVPAIAEAFVVMSLDSTTTITANAVTFAADTANAS